MHSQPAHVAVRVHVKTVVSEALTEGRLACRYELHIRDFSAMDESVPEALRGKYLAFAEPDSLVSDFSQVQPCCSAGRTSAACGCCAHSC